MARTAVDGPIRGALFVALLAWISTWVLPPAAAAAPAAPVGLLPADGAVLASRGVTLSWEPVLDPGGAPVHYELLLHPADRPDEPLVARFAIDPDGPARQDGHALLVAPLDGLDEVTAAGGTPSAGVAFVPGRHGSAAEIAGADAIVFPADEVFRPSGGTIEPAARLNHDLADIEGFQRFVDFTTSDEELLSVLVAPQLDAVYGHITHEGRQHNALVSVPWLAGEWHHIAYTWGAGGQRLYLDGTLAASDPFPGGPAAGGTEFVLGNDAHGWSGIDAALDDLRISAVQRRLPAELRALQTEETFVPGGAYAWKVRAATADGAGPWSPLAQFTVDASAAKPARLTGAVRQEPFLGFGVEWDAMFWQDTNRLAGVTEADFALVTERLAALGPGLVRMFVQVSWWEEAEGAPHFDAPALESLYRQLAVCQELGIDVILVVWRTASWLPDWRSDWAALARTTADLLEELARRELTAVRYLTVINEPNLEMGEPFDDYVALQQTVAATLRERGIDLPLVGPDESAGFDWFERATTQLSGTFELFDAHTYDYDTDSVAGIEGFVERRLEAMAAAPEAAGKPFFIGEFGSLNNLNAFQSADIDTFARGLFSAEGALRAMRAGAAAVLHWCLHDVYYAPLMKMGYGLWRFRDEDWEPRPIYTAWRLLSANAPPGSVVLEVEPTDPRLVLAAVRQPSGAVTLWAINRDTEPLAMDATLGAGLPAGDGRPWSLTWERYEEATTAVPAALAVDAGAFQHTLPPQSLTVYVLRPPPPEAPEPVDAAAVDVAGPADAPDAGDLAADTGGPPPPSECCDCRMDHGRGASAGWLLVLLGVAITRRRRREALRP